MTFTPRRSAACVMLATSLCWAQPALHLKSPVAVTLELGATGSWETLSRIAKSRTSVAGHLILQYDKTPTASDVEELRSRGVKVLGYVPVNGLSVSVRKDTKLDGIEAKWVSRLEPWAKRSTDLPADGLLAAAVFVVEFHPDVEMDEARQSVGERGMELVENPSLLPFQLLARGTREQADSLSEWDEVAYIFPASAELAAGVPLIGCMGGLTELGAIASYVQRSGDGWDGPGKNATSLYYTYQALSGKMPLEQQRAEFQRALAEWAKYVKVTFTLGTNPAGSRTLNVLFGAKSHGDPYPFDGPGSVLAHTFYPAPPNQEPLAGDLHFDEDENWHVGTDVDFFSVALHELGHALGLGHADKPGAVMYPYYRKSVALTAEDTSAIQELYAAADRSGPSTPTTPAQGALALTITDPQSGTATSAASVTLRGTIANASGAPRLTFASDRGLQASGNLAAGVTTWSAGPVVLAAGTNNITVALTDGTGAAAQATVRITRNVTGVAVQILSPSAAGSYQTALQAVVLGGAASGDGVTKVNWVNSRGGQGEAAVSGGAWVTGQVAMQPGVNTITVSVQGAAGSSSASIEVTCAASNDTAPPALRIASPTSTNAVTSAATLTMKGTALDNVAVAEVTWTSSLGGSGKAQGTTDWTIANIPLLTGSQTIRVTAKDPAGNSSWRAITVTRR